MESPGIIIRQVELGPMMNFEYLIGCPKMREAAVVDPAWDVPVLLELARESDLKITSIFLTHGHPDHMNGLEELLKATDARVYLHAEEVAFMKEAAAFFGLSMDFMNRRSANFKPVSDGEEALVGRIPVRFLHTPGHTPGSQCFLVEGNLVSGDTLFINACGRIDLPGSDPEKMWHSLTHKLAMLPDDTILYPGHNYAERRTASMGEQKQENPYLRFRALDDFLYHMREP